MQTNDFSVMNAPSPGPSDAHGVELTPNQPASAVTTNSGQPSAMDSPYTSARSPSGHLVPYSPTPARRYSGYAIPWMSGSQTSLHDEPSSINHEAPQESILRTNSSTTVHHLDNHTPSSGIRTHLSHQPSSLHPTSDLAAGTPPINYGIRPFPQAAHIHFDTNNLEPHRSTPYSIKSVSQLSVSQKSCSSRNSVGRASYREHRGPPARDRTPTPGQDVPSFRSQSPSRAELGGSVAFGAIIAPPRTDDPNRPGEPIVVNGFRFSPMSISGILRYDEHRKFR